MIFKLIQKLGMLFFYFFNSSALREFDFFKTLFLKSYMQYKDWFEYGEIEFAVASLKYKDGVVLDCGANVGWFSLRLASLRPEVCIIAIEPFDENIVKLKTQILSFNFKNISVLEMAVSNSNSILNLQADPKSHANAMISEKPTGLSVTAKTIDSISEDFERVSLIKIDTQGHELEVLHGALWTIHRSHPALIIELDNSNPNRTKMIYDILYNYNYKIYRKPDSKVVDYPELSKIKGYFNIYCL